MNLRKGRLILVMKYELHNPNKFPIPVFLDEATGDFTRVIIPPRQKITIDKSQISDSIKNLTKAPRYLLRMIPIKS